MLRTLSVRNAKRQAKDYLVYFVTVVIAAALLYAFNSLIFSDEIEFLGQMADDITMFIVLASTVIVFIIGWLVHYMTGFMLKRRSKEFGMYMLLGIEADKIRKLFLSENICVGGLAFLTGIPSGLFMYQIIRAIVMNAFGQSFRFDLLPSGKAILLTLVYVILIYSFSMWKGRRKIRQMNIHQLLYFEKEQEKELAIKGKKRKGLSALSVAAGAISLVMFWFLPDVRDAAGYIMIAVILGIVFLFGFYLSIGQTIAAYFSRRTRKKYKKDNLFLFRMYSSKMTTMSITVATLALLFTIVMATMGMGLMMDNTLNSQAGGDVVFDLTISENFDEDYDYSECEQYLREHAEVADSHIYTIYKSDSVTISQGIKTAAVYEELYSNDFYMKRSDYDKLREMLGYTAANEPADSVIIHCSEIVVKEMERFLGDYTTWETGGTEYELGSLYSEDFEQIRWEGNGYKFVVVVPDEAVGPMEFGHKIFAATAVDEFPAELYYEMPVEVLEEEEAYEEDDYLEDDYEGDDYDDYDEDESFDDEPESEDTILLMMKSVKEDNNAMIYIVVVMPLFYITLIILITATTILVSQQLSDTDKYKKQYQVLSVLGMSREKQQNVLLKQMLIYYGVPVIFPFVFGFVILRSFSYIIGSGFLYGPQVVISNIAVVFGIFLFIYGIYFIVSYISLRQSVLEG